MKQHIVDQYINDHETTYQAKYCYHSCDWLGEGKYKFHYYIRDSQLRQIDIYLNMIVEDEVKVDIFEELHEQEKNAITIDALKRVRFYLDRNTTIPYNMINEFIKNPKSHGALTIQDIVHIWNYICYHEGKNDDSVYLFYTIYLEYIKELLNQKEYFAVMHSIYALFNEILYEVSWTGFNVKYLDQEYMMHQAYIRKFLETIDPFIEQIYFEAELLFVGMVSRFLKYPKLGFSIYPTIENLIAKHKGIFQLLLNHLNILVKQNVYTLQGNLMFELMESKYYQNDHRYYKTVISLLLQLVDEIVSIVNHEEQLQVGWMFIKKEGYQILLDAFDKSNNSYIYQWFKISEIPVKYHQSIKESLEKAIQYYANILEKEPRNLTALEHIANCNILLLESFN